MRSLRSFGAKNSGGVYCLDRIHREREWIGCVKTGNAEDAGDSHVMIISSIGFLAAKERKERKERDQAADGRSRES